MVIGGVEWAQRLRAFWILVYGLIAEFLVVFAIYPVLSLWVDIVVTKNFGSQDTCWGNMRNVVSSRRIKL